MPKKVVKMVKLQVPAGKATPAPPVGPALGQAGVNIMAFVKEMNELWIIHVRGKIRRLMS